MKGLHSEWITEYESPSSETSAGVRIIGILTENWHGCLDLASFSLCVVY